MQTIWKGAVSFGLVNVPVKMCTAAPEEKAEAKKPKAKRRKRTGA